MAITLKQYSKNRDVDFATELSPVVRANATQTVRRANKFLLLYHTATGSSKSDTVNSGWQPPSVNAATAHAARNSPHLTAEAVDASDDGEVIDHWLATEEGHQALISCDPYAEAASAAPRWTHLQTCKPESGKRIFQP